MSPLQERKFAHEPVFSQHRGKVKVACRCGDFQSAKFANDEEGFAWDKARRAYKEHVGLREREIKPSILRQLQDRFA